MSIISEIFSVDLLPHEWSIKEQTIDVSKFGALLDETDKVLVGAEFRDVYCGNDYLFLEVELKDEERSIIKRLSTGKRPTKAPKLCTWGNKSTDKIAEIIDIPSGKTVNYITYRDGGKSVKTFVDTITVTTRTKAFAVI
jgi:hypothetical protein